MGGVGHADDDDDDEEDGSGDSDYEQGELNSA